MKQEGREPRGNATGVLLTPHRWRLRISTREKVSFQSIILRFCQKNEINDKHSAGKQLVR